MQPGDAGRIEPETGRYADMCSIMADLRWVRETSSKALSPQTRHTKLQIRVQVDAIIRYSRCFKRQRDKFRIPGEWVECLGEGLRSAHTGILAALDNQLQDVPEGREEEAILAVARPAATDDIFAIASFATLQDLADHFTKLLREEMSREAIALRELARRISFC